MHLRLLFYIPLRFFLNETTTWLQNWIFKLWIFWNNNKWKLIIGHVPNLISLCLQVVDVSFASFNIDNPPTCSIPWNYTYRYPTERSYSSLPGCFTKVVQPAFDFYVEHSFFFKIYDWKGHFETTIVPEWNNLKTKLGNLKKTKDIVRSNQLFSICSCKWWNLFH